MNVQQTVVTTLGVVALVFGALGVGYPANQAATQKPTAASSIQVRDQDREERKDVKVDAGNGNVLHVDAADEYRSRRRQVGL
jgi:hypothetical protein